MSQMIRTFDQNSKEDQLDTDLIEVKKCLVKSGYKEDVLNELETKIREKRNNSIEVEGIQANNTQSNIITFPLYYFDGINEFKKETSA